MPVKKVEMAPPASSQNGRFNPTNSMIPGSPLATADLPDHRNLAGIGYLVYAATSLKVLNADPWVAFADPFPYQIRPGRSTFDLVVNGTFTYTTPSRRRLNAYGAVMRNGVLESQGVDKAMHRGGVAILEDGTIVAGRQTGMTATEIQSAFSHEGRKVHEFMGGGALLIDQNRPVSSQDLKEVQCFEAGRGGIRAPQFGECDHTLIGFKRGQCYVIVAQRKDGIQIIEELERFGFSTLIKFDGGDGCYCRDCFGNIILSETGLGFGVKTRPY